MSFHRVGQMDISSRPRTFRFLVRVGVGRRCNVLFALAGFLFNPADRPSFLGNVGCKSRLWMQLQKSGGEGGIRTPVKGISP